jgi:hypothetical protein
LCVGVYRQVALSPRDEAGFVSLVVNYIVEAGEELAHDDNEIAMYHRLAIFGADGAKGASRRRSYAAQPTPVVLDFLPFSYLTA